MSACQSTSSSRTCGLIAKIAGIVLMLAGVDAFYSFQYVKNSGLYLIAGFALLAGEYPEHVSAREI